MDVILRSIVFVELSEIEEVVLVSVYIDTFENRQVTLHSSSYFLRVVMNHLKQQLGASDCSSHQIGSKWEDMQQKVKEFNVVFTHKMNTRELGVSVEEILNATK